eukprot:3234078-Alexandrium_andersonii.AAC.1
MATVAAAAQQTEAEHADRGLPRTWSSTQAASASIAPRLPRTARRAAMRIVRGDQQSCHAR